MVAGHRALLVENVLYREVTVGRVDVKKLDMVGRRVWPRKSGQTWHRDRLLLRSDVDTCMLTNTRMRTISGVKGGPMARLERWLADVSTIDKYNPLPVWRPCMIQRHGTCVHLQRLAALADMFAHDP